MKIVCKFNICAGKFNVAGRRLQACSGISSQKLQTQVRQCLFKKVL